MGTCAANRGSVLCGGSGPTPKTPPAPRMLPTCARKGWKANSSTLTCGHRRRRRPRHCRYCCRRCSLSPNSRTGGAFLRAEPLVAVRHRPKSALGARRVALKGPQARVYVRQFGRMVGRRGSGGAGGGWMSRRRVKERRIGAVSGGVEESRRKLLYL